MSKNLKNIFSGISVEGLIFLLKKVISIFKKSENQMDDIYDLIKKKKIKDLQSLKSELKRCKIQKYEQEELEDEYILFGHKLFRRKKKYFKKISKVFT